MFNAVFSSTLLFYEERFTLEIREVADKMQAGLTAPFFTPIEVDDD
jgi:hypothetical protein